MSTASRTVRKNRRIKRNASLAFKAMRNAMEKAFEARNVAAALEKELQKRENALVSEESFAHFMASKGLDPAIGKELFELITKEPVVDTTPALTITKVDEAEV